MQIEIKANDKLWIEIELDDTLGKNMVRQIDEVFSSIATDKNKQQITGFSRNPKALH